MTESASAFPSVDDDQAEADYFEATLLRDSLGDFIKSSWPLVEQSEPLIWGWHIEAICEKLEAVTRGDIRRLVMNIPPRHMKSLATAVFWPAWEWLTHPELRYLTLSFADNLATRDAFRTRRLMRTGPNPLHAEDPGATLMQRLGYQGVLKLLGKTWHFEGDQNVKSRYYNDMGGFRIATGIGGGATGEGGDRVLLDDPHKLEEWNSEAKLKEAVEFATEIIPSRVGPKTAVVLIMQRVNENDVTGGVLGEIENVAGWPGVEQLCLPEVFEPAHPHVSFDDPRLTAGELIWPERFDEDGVKEHQAIGSLRYAGNYQQRPAPAEGNIFKRDNWRFYGPNSEKLELPPTWERVLTSWDLTFGEPKNEDVGASWVVGQVWGKDGPDVYLLGQIRARMSFPDQKAGVKVLRVWAPTDQVGQQPMILVEEKAAGKPLLEDLRKEEPALKGTTPTTNKTARAVAVQGYQEAGNVWLPATVIPCPPDYEPTPTSRFVNEAATFPAGTTDQVDVLSQSLQELFLAAGDEASSHQTFKGLEEPEVIRHGKRFVGEKYIDKEPPENPRR